MGKLDIDAFLESVREADQPRPDDRARIHRAFREKLARQGLSAPAPPIPDRAGEPPAALQTPATATTLGPRIALLVGAAAVAVALIHALPSVRATAPRAAASQAPAAPLAAPATGPRAISRAIPSAQAPQAPAPPTDDALASSNASQRENRGYARSQRVPARARPTSSTAAGGLELEIAMIASARSSLQSGRPQAALAQLAQHERQFSQGALRDERDGLRVLALCRLEPYSAGSEARARYLARAPASLLAAQVRAACGPEQAP
jgi:hypothetical protein